MLKRVILGGLVGSMLIAGAPVFSGEQKVYCWQEAQNYQPPNFEKFFPDDIEGGKKLDQLWENTRKNKDYKYTDEFLLAVKNGLRRTSKSKKSIISGVGGRFILGKKKQNPLAIEIMYHAIDIKEDRNFGVRYSAIYYGLSTVRDPSPAILHALADICMTVEDHNYIDRIAWGMQSKKAEITKYLQPYLQSKDPKVVEHANALKQAFNRTKSYRQYTIEKATEKARIKHTAKLPEYRKALVEGDSASRRKLFDFIRADGIMLIMDDSFIAAYKACAADPDFKIRNDVAIAAGYKWVWSARVQSDEVIDLMLTLSKDKNSKVRFNAVYYGLSTVRQKSDKVIERLLEMAFEPPISDMYEHRIIWALKRDQTRVSKMLQKYLKSEDMAVVKRAQKVYKDIVGVDAPGAADVQTADYLTSVADFCQFVKANYPFLELKNIDWDKVSEEAKAEAAKIDNDHDFCLFMYKLVAKLEDSHAYLYPGKAKTVQLQDFPNYSAGFSCLEDDKGQAVVYFIDRNGSAAKSGLKVGSIITEINGKLTKDLIAERENLLKRYSGWSSQRYLHYNALRSFDRITKFNGNLKVTAITPAGEAKVYELNANVGSRYINRLPIPIDGVRDAANVAWKKLDDNTGYIYVRRIRRGLEGSLDAALKEFGDVKGVIIDVRGNSGGGFDSRTAFLNFSKQEEGGKNNVDRPHFDGPIAMLIDSRCISAGEGWSSWFMRNERAKFFGQTTAGASARKTFYTLTNKKYKVKIPVKGYRGFLKRMIERRGLEPDVEVKYKASDIAAGKDTVLEAAKAWLEQQAK